MSKSRFIKSVGWLCGAMVVLVGSVSASGNSAILEQEHVKLRYGLLQDTQTPGGGVVFSDEFAMGESSERPKHKSPAKAFLLSLAVPGLGQYYYGSRVKPLIFFGTEVATWVMYFHFHSEGERITDEFEAFNRAHWDPQRYEDYLFYVYGVRDDDSVAAGTVEVSHHLPDGLTQQYYEMTGKYDQFAWGWDDARLNGVDLDSDVEAITGAATTPYSARRFYYEGIRNDANTNFDNATRMVILSMANRVISAFEALFTTRSINKKVDKEQATFGDIRVRAKLKSYYTFNDTPFIVATYKF